MISLIKLKAYIYQYTGIYLAHKEENEYLTSEEFWEDFNRIKNNPDNDMSDRDIQGTLIGSWQCRGDAIFARPLSKRRWGSMPKQRKLKLTKW